MKFYFSYKKSLKKQFYRISANSFRGNYSFLNLALCKSAEIIPGRKLFKGGNYLRKYGISKMLLSLKMALMPSLNETNKSHWLRRK